jgi:hypothetical protein
MVQKGRRGVKLAFLFYRIVRHLIPGPHPFVSGGGYNEQEQEDGEFVHHFHLPGNELMVTYTFCYGLRAKRGTMIHLNP